MTAEPPLTKIYVGLPNNGSVGGEGMWARPLGGDLYEVHNVPFYAYDLNFLDVVEAVPAAPEQKPAILRIVRRSGHRTLRVIFLGDAVPEPERIPLLETLRPLGASIEGATKNFFAIDIQPTGDYDAIRARLDEWASAGRLDYETCEARCDGSFDDAPAEGD